MTATGQEIMARLDEAATCSQPGPGVTRLYLTEQHRDVLRLVRRWMEEAGLKTRLDSLATLVGRLEGTEPGARTLILGSHVDTVRQGGKYDGMLGVVLPILVLRQLHSEGIVLPFAVEVAAFGDEEGVRFPTTLIGSRGLAGTFASCELALCDRDGTSLERALRDFGLDPAGIGEIARDPERVLAYVEVHIEQGPVLEAEDQPVGVVTAITGIERHTLTFTGKASHAGTTPMTRRHDALAGAAAAVLEVEQVARETDHLVATIGRIAAEPNAINVVPGRVELGLDLRSPDRRLRHRTRQEIIDRLARIAAGRGLEFTHRLDYEQEGATCAVHLVEALERAVEGCGYRPARLLSGAGHDGLAMAGIADIGMLFVRCRDGLSHHPDEQITAQDAEAAARVLTRFLKDLAETMR